MMEEGRQRGRRMGRSGLCSPVAAQAKMLLAISARLPGVRMTVGNDQLFLFIISRKREFFRIVDTASIGRHLCRSPPFSYRAVA